MQMEWQNWLWLVAVVMGVSVLVRLAAARWSHLQGLAQEHLNQQIAWERRRRKAVELRKNNKVDGETAD